MNSVVLDVCECASAVAQNKAERKAQGFELIAQIPNPDMVTTYDYKSSGHRPRSYWGPDNEKSAVLVWSK